MLLNRDYISHMSKELVKKLIAGQMIETKAAEAVTQQVRALMAEELSIEDRLNDEVRNILTDHAETMRRTGVSYQEMYNKVKGELARQRNLILR